MSYQVNFSFYAPEQSVQVITGAPTIEIIANEENKIDRKKKKKKHSPLCHCLSCRPRQVFHTDTPVPILL
jgi:hypothetical protein